MFTALLLWLCHRTSRPGAAFFVGFVLAMAGIALISLAEGESFDFNPSGCLLALGSAVSWGVYGPVSGKPPSSKVSTICWLPRKSFSGASSLPFPSVWAPASPSI